MKKIIFGGALTLFLLGSCGSHNHKAEAHAHEGCDHDHEHSEEIGDVIVFPAGKAKAAGVRSAIIEPGKFHQVIKTSGQVLAAQGNESTVVATVAGVVSFGNKLLEGMDVSRGATLVTVSAGTMIDGDPVQKARVAYEAAKAEYERMKPLAEKQIVSQKEFIQAQQNYENARISYETIGRNHSPRGQAITSPIAGFVKSIFVKEGEYVEVGRPLVSITQNRRLFLRAEVSEKYYAQLHNISSANFRTPYDDTVYQLSQLGGRLLSVGKSSDENTFYVPVTFEFDNKGGILPGSFVEIFLLSSPMDRVISVPATALIEEQGSFFVFLHVDDDSYTKREVTLGFNDGQNIQIRSGIGSGDRVVIHGAYQIKLATASNAMPAHSHEH